MLHDGERGMVIVSIRHCVSARKPRPGSADNGILAACAPWTLRTGRRGGGGGEGEGVDEK